MLLASFLVLCRHRMLLSIILQLLADSSAQYPAKHSVQQYAAVSLCDASFLLSMPQQPAGLPMQLLVVDVSHPLS